MTLCFMSPIIRWFSTIFIPRKKTPRITTYAEQYRLSYLSLRHLKVDLLLYRHFEPSSSLLLSKTLGSALAIRSFSQMHKSHFRDPQTHFCVCNNVCNYLCVCNNVCDVCVCYTTTKKTKKAKKTKSFLTNFCILLILNNHVNSSLNVKYGKWHVNSIEYIQVPYRMHRSSRQEVFS